MAVIVFLLFFREMTECSEAIARKNHDIVLAQNPSLPEKTPLQDQMTNSLLKNRFSESNHLPCKSEFARIKTPFREKSSHQICIQTLGHKCYQPLPSPTIEKCIMENGNSRFFGICVLHVEKNIEFSRENNRISRQYISIMLKAIIFDFDGVIWDTYEMNYTLSKLFDTHISERDFQDHHNGNVFETPKIKFKPEDIPVFFTKSREYFTENNIFPIQEVIQNLSKKYQLFIVSSTIDDNIEYFLKIGKINQYFLRILGCSTHPSKVEKFKMIFSEHNLQPDNCIFITDTIGDIKEARHLNLKTIAVTWGYHPKELLENEKPYILVDTPQELFEFIKNEA